ncbi:MAG: OmpA family protein [Flavisolibacter sp.]|jgi:OOP family OmpA-OmpF porin|nr:OmpA family protein [Flavisolibacter sp.]
MKKIALLLVTLISVHFVFAQEDAPGCKDSPLFNRMPNTVIGQCTSNYDEMEIPIAQDKVEKKEGTKTSIQYNYEKEEATAPSFFQIVKNFENAITKTGGKRIYYSKESGVATFSTRSGGKDIWVVLNDFGGAKTGNFELNILEMEAMKQDIAASEMLESLNKNGSVALYINFETGKADIKPESQKIVGQIAEMMKANPALKISIEGHTDNVGTPASNKMLSDIRAKAVMKAVTAEGIEATRLSARGWGQEKPTEDNSTEEGKAKNRRVEIVKM